MADSELKIGQIGLDAYRDRLNDEFGYEDIVSLSGTTKDGTSFTTITHGGEKPEGDPVASAPSVEDAVRGWYRSARQFMLDAGGGRIIWRCMPQLERDGSAFRVYSRMAAQTLKNSEESNDQAA